MRHPVSRIRLKLILNIERSFDENGIFIPFPQVTYPGKPRMIALPERFVDVRAKEA